MTALKSTLMAATAIASLFAASGAQAANLTYGAADLQGNGASSIINVLGKTFGCLGNDINSSSTSYDPAIAKNDGSIPTYSNFSYHPAAGAAYTCSGVIQPAIKGHYVSTGSGNGRTDWAKFTTSAITVDSGTSNPFSSFFGTHIQFAFSDSAAKTTDLADYSSSASTSPVSNGTGPAIQIPFYVLPVSLAYVPVYGKVDNGTSTPTKLSFNLKAGFTVNDGAGNATGGLRMKKNTYCAIFNGLITNWNDPALQADNGGQSLMDPADTPSRWNSAGVPIKLVGRSDKSGTTNLLIRHLDAICGAGQIKTGNGGSDTLPTAAVGSAVYNSTTGAVTGTETPGKFGVVNGSGGIANTVGQAIPDPVIGSGNTTLGGYLGYVGADFVLPATAGSTSVPALFSAALQSGTGTSFKTPTAANAVAAFGTTYLPPQSDSKGQYVAGTTINGYRNNPAAWVLPTTAANKLANPAAGYPIVGTTNLLIYTCYSTSAKREAITALAALQFGLFKTAKTGTFPATLLTSAGKNNVGLPLGLLANSGLASLPKAWQTAITHTFFSNWVSTTVPSDNPGTLNLWIQDKLPVTAADQSALVSNPVCTAGAGA